MFKRKYKRISFNDRLVIEKRLNSGERVCAIADELDINRTHLYKEMKRGMDTDGIYHAKVAESSIVKKIKS